MECFEPNCSVADLKLYTVIELSVFAKRDTYREPTEWYDRVRVEEARNTIIDIGKSAVLVSRQLKDFELANLIAIDFSSDTFNDSRNEELPPCQYTLTYKGFPLLTQLDVIEQI